MLDFNRNNLGNSDSPYLRQHRDNPVWWQEWHEDVIAEAVRLDRPILVSVGYATCHWCHVMAAQTFSDPDTADLLNRKLICIKIDRELRPDIDHYLMSYLVEMSGQGGWPLNAFLTPDLKPIFALTYAPADRFSSIAAQVASFYRQRAGQFEPYVPSVQEPSELMDEYESSELVRHLLTFHDPAFGGFGQTSKFPPHSSLLFLLYQWRADGPDVVPDPSIRKVCEQTLDAMQLRGLHDHLQGGIFRYCVDRQWTIPHFEKMLYDQAMALWNYALAARLFGKSAYRDMAMGILRCLEESFARDGLFVTAHDADTEHREGETYLWSLSELQTVLSADEFARFAETYDVSLEGNFEARNHLIRKTSEPMPEIEAKLLAIRRNRAQPQCDDKVLCSQNALVAIALIQAGRHLDLPNLEQQAARFVQRLLDTFWDGEKLGHALAHRSLQTLEFLADAAAMLLAVSFLAESDPSWLEWVERLIPVVERFRKGEDWLESLAEDFPPVTASWFDHPTPSGVSLAEMALIRAAFQTGREVLPRGFRQAYQADFYNLAMMVANGSFHILTRKQLQPWLLVPPNTLQVRGEPEVDCYCGVCVPIHQENS